MNETILNTSQSKHCRYHFVENTLIALTYYLTARLGQTLAIPPGNITPVWIPSGILLAAALIRGYHIWPGIFLGAFIGNVWAYVDFNTTSNIIKCLFTGSANGMGDVICSVGAACCIERFTQTRNPFEKPQHIIQFIQYGVILGPGASALFGVTALFLAGFVPFHAYFYTFITWWTGDGVGVLIITPVIVAWIADKQKRAYSSLWLEMIAFSLIVLLVIAYCLNMTPFKSRFHLPLFSLAPFLIWSSFRFGQCLTFIAVLVISSIIIIATAKGMGPFSKTELNVAIMEMQWFIAAMSITIFILSTTIKEWQSLMVSLKKIQDNLEHQVKERTRDLSSSNADLKTEIRERKRIEKTLKESEEKYKGLLESLNAGVVVHASDTAIVMCNPYSCELLGLTMDQMMGKEAIDPAWQFFNEDGSPLSIDQYPVNRVLALKTSIFNQVVGVMRPNKDELAWVMANGFPLTSPDGSINQVVINFIDITEVKKNEVEKTHLVLQLQQSQKMEAIGALAGGIAHDFNNMIGVIIGNISYAQSIIKDENKEIADILTDVSNSAEQAQHITKQLLTFSKGGKPIKSVFDFNQLIKDSAALVLRGTPSKCQFHLSENLMPIEADKGQLNQVTSNLLINATQSMPNGGTITITTENMELSSSTPLPLHHGKYLKWTIEDQGSGIVKEDLRKIFDPYYSTKQMGSGLGLSITYSIINKHKGHIQVESTIGKGTLFTIYLPTTKQHKATDTKSVHTHQHSGKILVMDDQEPILKMAERILNRMGYQVATSKDGKDAIEIFKAAYEKGEGFDAVILDLTVPGGMGGAKCITALSKIDPKVKAIVSSGYSSDPVMSDFKAHGFVDIVPKPYTRNELAEVLNRVIGVIPSKE